MAAPENNETTASTTMTDSTQNQTKTEGIPPVVDDLVQKAKSIAEATGAKLSELDSKLHVSTTVKEAADVVGQKAKEVDERFSVVEKTKEVGAAVADTAKKIDEKYGVADKTRAVVDNTTRAIGEFDAKHQISQKTNDQIQNVVVKAKEIDDKHGITTQAKAKWEEGTTYVSEALKKLDVGSKTPTGPAVSAEQLEGEEKEREWAAESGPPSESDK